MLAGLRAILDVPDSRKTIRDGGGGRQTRRFWGGMRLARTGPARTIRPPVASRAATVPPPRVQKPRRLGWRLRLFLLCLAGFLAALIWLLHDLPRPDAAFAATRRPSVTLLASDGSTLATQGDLYGERVRLRDLPPALPAALLAVEDRRFFAHPGIDAWGIARALYVNFTAGEVVQGGSTLTQQLAKNLFLTPERTVRRKLQEALLALWLERRFSKTELLELYLNRVYLGAGAWGVDAAARTYFGVTAKRLAVWQSALLAGLPKAPSRLNPRAEPDLAVARAAEVLDAMVETGALTRAQASAEQSRMRLAPPGTGGAGWFADWALADLAARFPGNADLVLRATLDAPLQAAAEARLAALLDREGAAAGVTEGAILVLHAASGAVRAMVGGRDRADSRFNRATQARRQPGSAFKPFVFLAALEAGANPDDTVSDAPLRLGGWTPGNGNWTSRGEITLEDALAHSVNTATVRVLQATGGPRTAIAVATRLGLRGPHPNDATVALGTGQASLLELTAAMAAIANGGDRITPYGLASTTSGGRTRPLPFAAPEPAIAPATAAALRGMLQTAVARGTGRAAALPGRNVGGKTGTTQEFRDAWFVGFVGDVAIGVWLGNDDGRPMAGVAGGGLAARLFREVASALH